MKLIYTYRDYRKFLADFLQDQSERGLKLSARALSSRAHLGPPNYVSLIVSGKRRLSVKGALAVADIIGLTRDETDYFITLIQFCESEDKREQRFFEQRLNELRKNKPRDGKKIGKEDLTSNWRLPIILMLAVNKSRQEALARVASALNLPAPEVQQYLNQLEKDGLLLLDDVYSVRSTYLTQQDPRSMKKSLAEFLRAHTDLLAKAVAREYSSDSKHIVHVLGAKGIRKNELFSILERASEAGAELVADDDAEELFMMHLHCVPLKNYLGVN